MPDFSGVVSTNIIAPLELWVRDILYGNGFRRVFFAIVC
jgi:hypothetical protein